MKKKSFEKQFETFLSKYYIRNSLAWGDIEEKIIECLRKKRYRKEATK